MLCVHLGAGGGECPLGEGGGGMDWKHAQPYSDVMMMS